MLEDGSGREVRVPAEAGSGLGLRGYEHLERWGIRRFHQSRDGWVWCKAEGAQQWECKGYCVPQWDAESLHHQDRPGGTVTFTPYAYLNVVDTYVAPEGVTYNDAIRAAAVLAIEQQRDIEYSYNGARYRASYASLLDCVTRL